MKLFPKVFKGFNENALVKKENQELEKLKKSIAEDGKKSEDAFLALKQSLDNIKAEEKDSIEKLRLQKEQETQKSVNEFLALKLRLSNESAEKVLEVEEEMDESKEDDVVESVKSVIIEGVSEEIDSTDSVIVQKFNILKERREKNIKKEKLEEPSEEVVEFDDYLDFNNVKSKALGIKEEYKRNLQK